VLELPPYSSEPKPETAKQGASRRIASVGRRLNDLFVHQNTIICFGAWYLLSLVLIAAGVKIALHYYPELKMDTVILSTIIGVPVAGATAAVTLPRLRKQDPPFRTPPAKEPEHPGET